MLMRIYRRVGLLWITALALTAWLPNHVQAQHTGLFPLRPIKRERVPCANEDPVYRLHREQYYGYFPTCWRKFPDGWGCPSPEAPDPSKSFRDLPRETPQLPEEYRRGPDDIAPPPRDEAPNGLVPLPKPRDDMFGPTNPNSGPPPRGNNPSAANLPGLPPALRTASAPPASMPVTPSELTPKDADAPGVVGDSLVPLPDRMGSNPIVPPGPEAFPNVEAPTTPVGDPGPSASLTPEQAPQRRGLLSGLFGGLRRR